MSALSKTRWAIQREWGVFMETLRSPGFRELFRWCIPALVLGAIARVLLTVHFPYGYFQGDTPDFLVTAERLLRHHRLVIHGKKAFLAPILFTIPFLLHIPALIIIPIAQHLAGLAATVMAGALVRCWFRLWKVMIVPLTLIYTLNPALLWFEHALMAECHYLFCATGAALAGTLLVRRQTLRRFVWLIVALFFTAGSRPEGKLFVAFGLGVVALAYLGSDWKLWARRMGVMLVCSAGIWMCTRSTQAGLLLYSSVLPLAPEVSKAAPGLPPIETESVSIARTKYNSVERRANEALHAYLKSMGQNANDAHIGALAQKLAIEAIRRDPLMLPSIAADKYLLTCRPDLAGGYEDTSGGFTPFWIYDKQAEALSRRSFMKPMMRGVAGRELGNDAEIQAFLHSEYKPLDPDWFTALLRAWSEVTLGLALGSHGADKQFIPGWPAFCIVAALGMLAALIPRDRMWRFHWPFLAALMGVWFVVMLTGIVLPRYRFVFEPFWIFYIFLIPDYLWSGVMAVIGRGGESSTELPLGSKAVHELLEP